MRLVLPLALLLAAVTSRQGCGDSGGGTPPYDPCGAKACGSPCTLCPPGATDCAEIAVLKACDAAGKCVVATTPFPCPVPDPCAGLACGQECTVSLPCHFATPPCLAPQVLGHCDITGQCLAGDAGSCFPHPDCAGKACGASCNPCGPAQVCPTFVASACDPWGRCAAAVPGLCACAGKACGAPCDPCGGLCMNPVASACDATGRCVPPGTGVACGP